MPELYNALICLKCGGPKRRNAKWCGQCRTKAETCPRCGGIKAYQSDTCLPCRKELRKAGLKFHSDKGVHIKGRPATQSQGKWSGVGEPGSPAALAALEMCKQLLAKKPNRKPVVYLPGAAFKEFGDR